MKKKKTYWKRLGEKTQRGLTCWKTKFQIKLTWTIGDTPKEEFFYPNQLRRYPKKRTEVFTTFISPFNILSVLGGCASMRYNTVCVQRVPTWAQYGVIWRFAGIVIETREWFWFGFKRVYTHQYHLTTKCYAGGLYKQLSKETKVGLRFYFSIEELFVFLVRCVK